MRQVEGILGEVKRSYDTLKVQSEKTLKYRALRDEVFNHERDIQLLRLKQFRYERDERNGKLLKRGAERDRILETMEAENRALEENMDEVNSMEGRLVECQKNIYGLAVEKNALEKEAKLLAGQREENRAKIAQNESREKAVGIRIEELNDDAGEQDAVVRDLGKKTADIEENIRSFEENIRLAASRIGDNDAAVLRAEEEIRSLQGKQAELEKGLEAITDDIVAALDAGLREAGYSTAERRNAEDGLNETLARLRTVLAGRETLIRDLAAAAERAFPPAPAASGEGEGAEGPGSPAAESPGAGVTPEELRRIAESLAAGLAEAAADAERAAALFESYRKSTPSFIDEFLAPEGIITKKRSLDGMIRGAREGIGVCRERIDGLRGDNADLSVKIDEYRATLEDLRVNRAQMGAQARSAEEQARLIRRELAGQEGLLKNVRDELFLDRRRFGEIEERIAESKEEIDGIERRGVELTAELEKLEQDIQRRNGDVAGKQAAIKKRTEELAAVQQAMEKLHLELVQSETEIKNIQDNFRETHSRDLMEFEERIFTITAPPAELREKLAAARQGLRDLGAVNLMAPEEFAETKERYVFLSGQLEDLEKGRRDLENLSSEIRTESTELFLATYNKIKKNFHNMFRRLFGGGRAELHLQDGNHVLESGIEIYAQPPGKKLENINLLSGGERSMTAVALLFATYMVKPSPFCLLDEIDAALDESNVGRFVQLLREFGNASQFIVITHNKKTVTGAGTLLGVTMEELGITKVISVRLENGETARTAAEPVEFEAWEEEEVEFEEGRELPAGIDDPALVSDADLRPIRSLRSRTEGAGDAEAPASPAPAGNEGAD
jgi:chromosome segregation protein